MRIYILLLLALSCFSMVKAQTDNVYISVAVTNDAVLDGNTKAILKNKLLQIISIEGVAATECGAIIMVPEVNVLNSHLVAGGMHNITSVELGVTITVRNMITNTVFHSMQVSTSGEGYSVMEAQRAAINKINPALAEYQRFVETTKTKISEYYRNNTAAIIAKANTLAAQQAFDEALALLATYPESLVGYAQVSATMTAIFNKCQTQNCSQILLSAQAAYAQRDYATAAELASMIDAQSSCASQAKTLLASVKKGMDKEYNDMIAMEKEQIALEKERIQKDERLRLARIKAVKDIASAYFQRQTKYIFI